jgi:TRAP-type C4-dicarboxylate transport system substrate-binding protein
LRIAPRILLVLGTLVLGWSSPGGVTSSIAAPGERQLVVTVGPDDTPWADTARRIAARVQRAAKDKLRVQAATGGAAGDEIETAQKCVKGKGRILFWGGSAGSLAAMVPELDVFELPFLFDSDGEVDAVMRGAALKPLQRALEARGLSLYGGATEVGWRNYAGQKPLRSASDFTGLSVRSMENPLHLEMWRALGAHPMPLPVHETLGALQEGTVVAFDQSPVFLFATSWHRAIKTYTVSRHIYQVGLIVACKGALEVLPPAARTALLRSGTEDTETNMAPIRALGVEVLGQLRREGISVVELTSTERNALRERLRPVRDLFKKRTTPLGRELLEAIEQALRQYRGRL